MKYVEYIESTGTQYIDSGIKASSNIKIEYEFFDCQDISGGDKVMWGFRNNSWSSMLGINNGGNTASTNIMYVYYGGDGNAGRLPERSSAKIILSNGYLKVDDTEYTFTAVTFNYNANMFIFAANNVGVVFNNSRYKLKYFKIWENDILVRDFVPIINDNDEVGLWDTVNEIFYGNSGSGSFIPGPEIPGPTPPPSPTGDFPVYIQKNNSEPIKLDKELDTLLTTNVWLKNETSIIDPIFILECPLSDLLGVNYITVPAFGRSYFINNIISITTDLVELHCHVDVLTSFKNEIRNNKGIIFRQQKKWNLYLNDGVIQAYQNPIVTTQKFPKGFTESNYVLICAGSRNLGGMSIGDGGAITADPDGGGGVGNTFSKTTAGLVNYCKAQVGKPYWFGTFGNIATQDLLDYKRIQYPDYYPDPGTPPFVNQFGERVYDCVGLIKGYRWSETPASVPVYNASQDVDVKSLWSECIMTGTVDFSITSTQHLIGMCLFDQNLTHVGVYVGNGKIIEAQGHAYGVVENLAYDRRGKFTMWGIPNWIQITTSTS